MAHSLSYEVRYRLLKYVADHPNATQRELARELGISVGKVNYCLRALVDKGLVKIRNFRDNEKKSTYVYLLTPKGIEEKVNVTLDFLRWKREEYDLLSKEIERLTDEVRQLTANTPDV